MDDVYFRVVLNETINELAALKPISAVDPKSGGGEVDGGGGGVGVGVNSAAGDNRPNVDTALSQL